MSKSLVTKSVYVPAPTDGLNLISPPTEFLPTEARQLDNYYIYDWGIRERGASTSYNTADGIAPNHMASYTAFGGTTQKTLVGTGSNLYIYASGSLSLVEANGSTFSFPYKNNIFICWTDASAHSTYVGAYDYITESLTTKAIALGVATYAKFGFAYKNRLYIGLRNTKGKSIRYGGVAAIAGSFTDEFDFSTIFQGGGVLSWGSSWAYNQGVSTEELFVVGNDTGEVLVYSGDYPAAANWQLVGRADIPAPVKNADGNGSVLKSGQDLLVSTVRGVISLQQVFAGRNEDAAYYSISGKLGPVIRSGLAARSINYPFAYFPGGADLWVLNYERGAWSKFPSLTAGTITSVGCAAQSEAYVNSQPSSYLLVGTSDAKVIRIVESDIVASSSLTYTYKTAFFDFGSSNQKNLKLIRTLGRDINSNSFNNTVVSSNSFDDSTAGTAVSKATAVSSQKYVLQELAPGGTGQWLSLNYSKTGSNSAMNEISGTSIFYEEGGVY